MRPENLVVIFHDDDRYIGSESVWVYHDFRGFLVSSGPYVTLRLQSVAW
jgi:hypothetical protein